VHPLYSFLASTHVLFGISMFILIFATYCSPGMNSCKITEDETTRALRALYIAPAHQYIGEGERFPWWSQCRKCFLTWLICQSPQRSHMFLLVVKLMVLIAPLLKEKRKIAESSDKGESPKVL